jgi:hypothetical protein
MDTPVCSYRLFQSLGVGKDRLIELSTTVYGVYALRMRGTTPFVGVDKRPFMKIITHGFMN